MLFGKKKKPAVNESEILDQLAMALAKEVSAETGKPTLDILERIVETGESLKKPAPRRSSLVRRSAPA